MFLSDFVPETVAVTFRDQTFKVRGLTLEDLTVLIRVHATDLEALYQLYVTSSLAGEDAALSSFLVKVAAQAPALASDVIALAAGGIEDSPKARLLPISVQVRALDAISKLTFDDIGGPKNFVATMSVLMRTIMPALTGKSRNKSLS